MSTLEAILREQIDGEAKLFQVADADLHHAVAAASDAVGRIKEGASLQLIVQQEDISGIMYQLKLFSGRDSIAVLGSFRVPPSGYPVLYSGDGSFNPPGKIASAKELDQFFEMLARNPDSQLVRHLTFLVRKRVS